MRPLRITTLLGKMLFIGVAYAMLFIISMILFGILPNAAASIVSSLLDLAAIAIGTRVFRGRNEVPTPPRLWWRMTARPKSGFVLAALLFLGATVILLQMADVLTPSAASAGPVADAVHVVVWALIAIAYLHSSVRLVVTP